MSAEHHLFHVTREKLKRFIATQVYPAEKQLPAPGDDEGYGRTQAMRHLRAEAEREGLFNLFSSLREDEFGFSTVQIAELAELTGHSPLLAQDAIGSLNPDAEVINLIRRFGTPAQRDRWVAALAAGEAASALCITEPDVASSDPTEIRAAWRAHAGKFLLSGEKHWALGALNPNLRLLIVLAITEPEEKRRRRLSLILLPSERSGIIIGESATVFGYGNDARGGMPHIRFSDVEVDENDILGPRGQGLATVQSSLGPARLFHCMRLVGSGERALQLMCQRLISRTIRGKPLSEDALWMSRIADSRIAIDQSRAFALSVAAKVDASGLEAAAVDISAVKAILPEAMARVIDMAIQSFGAEGMSHALPLAGMWALARSLRFSDGPDEVHKAVVARAELKRELS
ncbi:acyl-CoA dehydrogenase family protein [Oryzicola mucosus]|uniref:Acyl-CoA dehydrogenase family protein n=1 Tax=Oryzicola mucosus TaxID=2767425 RepID=A0A8J6PPA2_9HYPH|nr:acyl-CoA dehydrogenase family protein [Oryzicola mucosus]MBD0417336.1 acyl-CoA dehydrogenase family protein [Oryzicola mucosus]